jgi:signal transduction histidine kinase
MNTAVKRLLICLLAVLAAVFTFFTGKGIAAVCAFAVLVLVLDIFCTYSQNKKIRRIYDDIERALNGDYSVQLDEYKEGGLSILHNKIHKLVIQLRQQAEELKKDKIYLSDAMTDISHQLKTPLTGINLLLSFLVQDISYEERIKILGKLHDLLGHVEWLIATLLKLAKFDADTVIFSKEKVDVKQLVKKVYEQLEISFELKNIVFETDIEENASYSGDYLWSVEALENIIKNCMEHTGEGGKIKISACENPIFTQITITDTGTGICAEDLPHLFERFYRGKNAESSSTGVGLALSSEVIRRQNGTVAVKNNLNEEKIIGAIFDIRFYKGLV